MLSIERNSRTNMWELVSHSSADASIILASHDRDRLDGIAQRIASVLNLEYAPLTGN